LIGGGYLLQIKKTISLKKFLLDASPNALKKTWWGKTHDSLRDVYMGKNYKAAGSVMLWKGPTPEAEALHERSN